MRKTVERVGRSLFGYRCLSGYHSGPNIDPEDRYEDFLIGERGCIWPYSKTELGLCLRKGEGKGYYEIFKRVPNNEIHKWVDKLRVGTLDQQLKFYKNYV